MDSTADNRLLLANLGLRISMLRRRRNISQHQFAEMVRMDRGYLIDIEKGRCNASIGQLSKIAQGLDLSLSDLLLEVDQHLVQGRRRQLTRDLLAEPAGVAR